jgi:glycosyltransferase involved in cell wall biosynthesis
MTSVSVAMATYNGAAHVEAQLASFVSQIRQPDELVVSDDGSIDGTVELVRAFARTAPFSVRIEVNPVNLGYAQNFNRALSLCKGELVFLSDQDDVWQEDKIARMVALAEANPDRGCFMNDALLTDASLQPAGVTKWGQIRAAGLPDSAFVMGCCAAFRRSLLKLLLPIPAGSRSHDNWLVEVSEMLGLVQRTEDTLQLYRRHGGNVSDFHVNRIHRPRLLKRMVEFSARFARRLKAGGMLAELVFLERVQTRLEERHDASVQLVGQHHTAELRAQLAARIDALRGRQSIQISAHWRRPSAIWKLWHQGGYRRSGGWFAAVKDALVQDASEEIQTQ